MSDDLYKFPSTPHLLLLGGRDVRDDKVLSSEERDEFLRHELVVEEKVDGANLGISFDGNGNIRVQNRGAYIPEPYSGQWKKLSAWLSLRADLLFDGLRDEFILFGEWCYAQHTVSYDRLPDWFVGFDIFDRRANAFFSVDARDVMLRSLGISGVPILKRGKFNLKEIQRGLTISRFGRGQAEGVYLRWDDGRWLVARAKVVRPEFVQMTGEHWSRRAIKSNLLI
ncbi:MAG: RNA ligase family protein [Chloroflexi bacterium]|nr:RNA ligase family protein [Chloroflexota bacterium]